MHVRVLHRFRRGIPDIDICVLPRRPGIAGGARSSGITRIALCAADRRRCIACPVIQVDRKRVILVQCNAGNACTGFAFDTLCTGKKIKFEKIPVFAPERFARVRPLDSMKRKQFVKGINQLSEEGAIQTFRRNETGMEEFIVGVVGELQFDVLTYRLKSEYGVDLVMDRLGYRFVRWITESPAPADQLQLTSTSARGFDGEENPVLFFENDWSIRLAQEKNKGLELAEIAPRKIEK